MLGHLNLFLPCLVYSIHILPPMMPIHQRHQARRPHTLHLSTSTMNVGCTAKSSVAVTPTRSALQASASARPRRRYYPVFLDQQQWLARDQRVERIWADAATHCSNMVELYVHPLERYQPMLVCKGHIVLLRLSYVLSIWNRFCQDVSKGHLESECHVRMPVIINFYECYHFTGAAWPLHAT